MCLYEKEIFEQCVKGKTRIKEVGEINLRFFN